MSAHMIPLRRVARIIAGQSPPSSQVSEIEEGRPFIQGNAEFGDLTPAPKWQCDSAPKRAAVGDILISVRAPVGALNVSGSELGIGRGVAALRAIAAENRYLYYAVGAQIPLLRSWATGTTFEAVSAEDIGNLPTNLPERDEQRRIADFLDDQVARIDKIIAGRRDQVRFVADLDLIAALDALRGASVSGPRHGSGLAWLGDIPESWPMATVHSAYNVQLGKMLDEKRMTGTYPVPYLRNTNVQWDRIDISDLKVMDIAPPELARYTVEPGDLLICEGGQPGRSAVWQGGLSPLGFQKALHRARPRRGNDSRWLQLFLRAAVGMSAFENEIEQATIAHLTGEQLRSTRIPMPPTQVQKAQVDEFDRVKSANRRLVAGITAAIDLLEELKRSLITAAVSGEFDVSSADGSQIRLGTTTDVPAGTPAQPAEVAV